MSNTFYPVEPASRWTEQLLRHKVEEQLTPQTKLALKMYGIRFQIERILQVNAGNGQMEVMVHIVASQVREFRQSVRLSVPEEWLQPRGGFPDLSEAV